MSVAHRTVATSFAVSACGWPTIVPSESSYTDDGGETSDASTTTSPPTTTASSTSTSTTTDVVDESSTTHSAPLFIQDPDGGSRYFECDIWTDDCPRGEKCMPWANDGGGSWNATKCTPIARKPGEPGDPCTVVDSGVSGIDDCEAGTMCWNVDGATNMGVCIAFCDGPQRNPTCPDPAAPCAYLGDSTPFMLCLPYCDPVLQDCPEETGCYPFDGGFYCAWDGSEESGELGDPCEFLNVCAPGLFCAPPSSIPGCRGAGCCSPFCDTTVEPPLCPDGLDCIAWYDEGQAIPGFENVGGCMEGGG